MYYDSNLASLSKTHPYLVERLKNFHENTRFDVFMDPKDPANVNIYDKHHQTSLYSSVPLEETLQKINDFSSYSRYPYLYFYGIGNGLFYKLLLSNDTHKRFVIIEPELELIYIALNLVDLSQEIIQGKISIFTADEIDFSLFNALLSVNEARVYAKVFELHTLLPYYFHYYSDNILETNKTIMRSLEHSIYSVGNDAIDALIGLEHHILNLPHLVRTPLYSEFITSIRSTKTAVIAATGPSLIKQLPLLKEIQDYVTIFCIDASMPILEQWGIRPDVVMSLERVEATAAFYQKASQDFKDNTIVALTSIVHPTLVHNASSQNVCLSMRPFGYTQMFELDEWGYFGIGMSAANMAFEMVIYSGFERVLLIGQDLAYGNDGKSHATGAVYGDNEISQSVHDIYVEAYGGNGMVRSTMVWKLFLNFYEKDIAMSHGLLDVYNCTEGGARIKGTIEIPFCDAVKKFVDTATPKTHLYPSKPSYEVSQKALKKAHEKLNDALSYSKDVKDKIEKLFIKVQKMTEKFEEFNKSNRLEEIDFDKVLVVIDEINEIKDYFHDRKFLLMYNDIIQSLVLHQELELAKIQVRDINSDIDRQAKLLEWVYGHRDWLFVLAGGIDAFITVIERSRHAVDSDPFLNDNQL